MVGVVIHWEILWCIFENSKSAGNCDESGCRKLLNRAEWRGLGIGTLSFCAKTDSIDEYNNIFHTSKVIPREIV